MKITTVFLHLVVLFCVVLAPIAQTQSNTASADPIQAFSFLAGSWHCDGKFTSSEKSISANLVFEPILDGKFLLFRHDDEPPGNYHAWSEWGWDAAGREFVSTIQDGTGGMRLFHSPGWAEHALVWSGGNLPNFSDQRFVFERVDSSMFRVSYSLKKNNAWLAVDSSVCARVRRANRE